MEAKLKDAAEQLVWRAQEIRQESVPGRFAVGDFRFWKRTIGRLLEEGRIEIGPNLNTGPDPDAMAGEIIALCGGDAAEAERLVTRSRRFA
jgi:hypothetical protein